ncbi:MAG: hypothetical protein ACFFBP_04440 [Promethearchaeota archaeon]
MSHRDVLKNIVKFSKKEYNEKKPLSLQLLRVKSKSVLKRGMLPNLNIKQVQGIFFLVVLDYKEYLRIYFFNREGQLLGGENIDKSPILMKKLKKETTSEYKLPKQKQKFTINDITVHFRKEFNKHLLSMNHLFGMNVKLPNIIVHEDLKMQMGRMMGCAIDRKEKALIISPEVYSKDIFEFIVIREIMYLYLRDLIMLFQDIENEIVFWYDLAILFTNFYLGNTKNDYLINIMENTTRSFLNFQNGDNYYFSDKVLEILKSNKETYTKNEITILFKNIFSCLKILRGYGIKLSYREFSNLFIDLCDLFSGKNNNFNDTLQKTNYYHFHYAHFNKTLAIEKDSEKDGFLVLMFKILSFKDVETKILSDLLKEIKKFCKNRRINEEIRNFKKLANDALVELIFSYKIKVNIETEIINNFIELVVKIENEGNFAFKDFIFNLSWKPKNRITQTSAEDLVKSRDLHANLKRKYTFSIESTGSVSFFLSIEFINPLNNNNKIKKKVKLDKLYF